MSAYIRLLPFRAELTQENPGGSQPQDIKDFTLARGVLFQFSGPQSRQSLFTNKLSYTGCQTIPFHLILTTLPIH